MALSSISDIKTKLADIVKNKSFDSTLYNSLDKLLRIAVAIKEKRGESGWASTVLDDKGVPIFDSSEQSLIESTMTPIVPLILYLLGEVNELPQRGGEQIGAEDIGEINKLKNKLLNGVKQLNDITNKYSRDGQILQFQSSPTDLRPFLPLAPTPLALISQIPVPPRAFVFFAYMAVDLARIFLAAPYPFARSAMSILLAIVDFLSGDWKKAILSLAGTYSENAMLTGFYGKMLLSVYNLLSPDLQENIFNGSFDVVKSLAVGSILQVFQIFAPEAVRAETALAFENLKKNVLDHESHAIEDEDLPPRKKYYTEITYEDIQNLQTIMKDPVRNCSEEFLRTIAILRQNSLMNNLLKLVGIPTNKEDIKRMCGKDIETYVNTLAKDRVEAEVEDKKEKPAGQMPAGQMPAGQMPAEQMPVEQKPVEQMPVEESEEQMPAEEPSEQMPSGQMSAGQNPEKQMPEVIPPQTLPVVKTGGKRKILRRALLFQS
jgi:hypothetical protein